MLAHLFLFTQTILPKSTLILSVYDSLLSIIHTLISLQKSLKLSIEKYIIGKENNIYTKQKTILKLLLEILKILSSYTRHYCLQKLNVYYKRNLMLTKNSIYLFYLSFLKKFRNLQAFELLKPIKKKNRFSLTE